MRPPARDPSQCLQNSSRSRLLLAAQHLFFTQDVLVTWIRLLNIVGLLLAKVGLHPSDALVAQLSAAYLAGLATQRLLNELNAPRKLIGY